LQECQLYLSVFKRFFTSDLVKYQKVLKINITFAFALNKENNFGKEHFGNSDKFALYTYKNNLISLNDELQNSFKSMDELQEHGSKMKGNAIISFLKEN
jgi:predicted Fe-Mo cluster-binding NifX family protein